MTRITFLFSLLAFALVSCQEPTSYQAEIKTVDSLLVVVDYLDGKLDSIDIEEMEQEWPEVNRVFKTLTGPKADPNDKDYWMNTIGVLALVETPYKKYLRDAPKAKEDLASSKTQLQGLRNSLEDNKLSPEEVEKYLAQEALIVGETYILVRKRARPAMDALAIWDTAAPRFVALADSMERLP